MKPAEYGTRRLRVGLTSFFAGKALFDKGHSAAQATLLGIKMRFRTRDRT